MDDLVQETFIVVHRRLPAFEGRSSLKTWLAGIAWRVASQWRRQRARKGRSEPLPDSLPDGGLNPQQAAIRSEALRRLDDALNQLDDDKRAVFVLAEMEQMSAPEIAEILALNPNTVYSRLRAARRAFEAAVARQDRGKQ
jgi:RNA polymerase sigma-70 factor (ECF subfamily)